MGIIFVVCFFTFRLIIHGTINIPEIILSVPGLLRFAAKQENKTSKPL